MKVVMISDQHGHLPKVEKCDLLLVGGDITPTTNHYVDFQREWLDQHYRDWLESCPADKIVGVAGNHDFVFQNGKPPKDLPWTYLEDEGTEYGGLRIWGTPWQPYFYNWAFNSPQFDDGSFLKKKFDLIPDETDIILGHGPPRLFVDRAYPEGPHLGCSQMLDAINRVQPRLMVCGHIHGGHGIAKKYHGNGYTTIVNAAIVDERYKPTHEILSIDI